MAAMIDNDAFGALLLRLYRAASDAPIKAFHRTTLEEIQHHLPFDGAIWTTSSVGGDRPRHSHHVWTIGGAPDGLAQQFEFDPDGSAALQFAQQHRGEPRILDFHEMMPGTVIGEFTLRAGMHQVMAMSQWDEPLNAFCVLVLGRRIPRPCFSVEDASWLRLLMPHLQPLAVRNVETQIRSTIVDRFAGDIGLAIVANDAIVLEEPGFERWMHKAWPAWSGPLLPAALLQALQAGEPRVSCGEATLHLLPGDGHTLLIATSPNALHTLTHKEFAVAVDFAQGKSHKEVARSHGLSPETVRSRLRTVYEKLSIGDKAELSKHFAQTEFLEHLQKKL